MNTKETKLLADRLRKGSKLLDDWLNNTSMELENITASYFLQKDLVDRLKDYKGEAQAYEVERTINHLSNNMDDTFIRLTAVIDRIDEFQNQIDEKASR